MKFFDVNNVLYFRRLISFIKFDIDNIVPKPCRMNFSSIHTLTSGFHSTFSLKWKLAEIFHVNKNFSFLFPGFEFYNHTPLFFRQWQVWRSFGITSWPVTERQRALKIDEKKSFGSSLLINAVIGLISINSDK